MSNSLAIAAVTATLSHLLEAGSNVDLPGTIVTTKPPEKARNGSNNNQLNLFLYQTAPNAALRNMPLPSQVKSGESGFPPLALNLYYLVTAYGQNDDDILSHRLLGRAMSVLHDCAVLDPDEIKAALAGNDLHEQIERVRITPQPMPLEEMSKLWMMLQAQYRISAAYQVEVVLLESNRPVKTPLPVLTRGANDQGVLSQTDLTPPFPTLLEVIPPNQQPSARLGDVLILKGHHLDDETVTLRLTHPRLSNPIELTPLPGRSSTEISFQIPNNSTDWIAGFYRLVAVLKRTNQPERVTNELPLSFAPQINTIAPNPAPRNVNGDVTLTLTCNPQVRLEQRVSLLLGDREILSQPRTNITDPLLFNVMAIDPGEYFVRLRVDGVDSLLVNRAVTPPVFDATQKVTIQ
ncbi:MAG TPA: DUF4255 domain-containing protein [Trichocoleus sp.]|jgi:hypothetical protein